MSLPDTIAVASAACAFVLGSAGLLVPYRDLRDLFDNGQRGAFAGAFVGFFVGAVVGVARP